MFQLSGQQCGLRLGLHQRAQLQGLSDDLASSCTFLPLEEDHGAHKLWLLTLMGAVSASVVI